MISYTDTHLGIMSTLVMVKFEITVVHNCYEIEFTVQVIWKANRIFHSTQVQALSNQLVQLLYMKEIIYG